MTSPAPSTPARPTCASCGASVAAGRVLCAPCRAATADALAAYWYREPTPWGPAPNLLDELRTTFARQSRMATANGSRSTERPLPYETRAGEAYREDAAWLLDASAGAGAPAIIARHRNPVLAARWLWAELDPVLAAPGGPDFAFEATRRLRRALAVVDRPPASWFAGRCRCGADLYAEDRAPMIRCRACGSTYDVAEQRARLLAGVEDVLATATEICRAVHLLDRPVTRSQLDNWAARGQLARRGRNAGGQHLYRVGDVLDLLARR